MHARGSDEMVAGNARPACLHGDPIYSDRAVADRLPGTFERKGES